MNKIKIITAYLWFQKPIRYTLILLLTWYMVGYPILQKHIQKEIETKIEIENLNKIKQKSIADKEKELKPLKSKQTELKHELDTLNWKIIPKEDCLQILRNSLNTLEIVECRPEISIIQKASASEKMDVAEVSEHLLTGTTRDQVLMDRICKYWKLNWKVSPLCNNWQLYNSMKWISEAYNVPFAIALGITYAESHIWVNYAWTCNESFNNFWGVKWRIWQDWKAIKDQVIPNNWIDYNKNNKVDKWENCWVYRFGSVEDYWQSKMRTLQKYNSCFNKNKPITCISYAYVWDAKIAEQSWINRVSLISY